MMRSSRCTARVWGGMALRGKIFSHAPVGAMQISPQVRPLSRRGVGQLFGVLDPERAMWCFWRSAPMERNQAVVSGITAYAFDAEATGNGVGLPLVV